MQQSGLIHTGSHTVLLFVWDLVVDCVVCARLRRSGSRNRGGRIGVKGKSVPKQPETKSKGKKKKGKKETWGNLGIGRCRIE
ncbi:hypothetical protein J3F83DRAFT_727912 [Trichoderma novae-zelandiae]